MIEKRWQSAEVLPNLNFNKKNISDIVLETWSAVFKFFLDAKQASVWLCMTRLTAFSYVSCIWWELVSGGGGGVWTSRLLYVLRSPHMQGQDVGSLQQHVAATKSCVVHTEGTCSSNKIKTQHTSNCVLKTFGTWTQIPAWSSTSWIPCNMPQGLNRFQVRVVRAKNNQHTRGGVAATCPWNMHLLHFLAFIHIVILLLLHVPAFRPLSVNNTWFCLCYKSRYMSLRHVPTRVRRPLLLLSSSYHYDTLRFVSINCKI